MKVLSARHVAIGLMLWAPLAQAVDWWSSSPLVMPAQPQAASQPLQNPPTLSWPLRTAAPGYELQLVGGVSTFTYRSVDNWLQLKSKLPAGSYRWKVRVVTTAGAAVTPWSDERSFTVAADTGSFVLPAPSVLMATAAQRSRPRAWPRGDELLALKTDLAGARKVGYTALKARVQGKIGGALLAEPTQAFNTMPAGAAKNQAVGDLRNALNNEQENLAGLELLWHTERNRTWLDEGKRRAIAFAKWDPAGNSGLVSHNQATRTLMYMLAMAYDTFYDDWTPTERQLLLTSIKKRYADIHDVIVGNGSLADNPYNPWSSYTLGYLVAVAPLISGDVPEANAWFGSAYSLYTATFPSWSGDDGGYANGTAYGVWDVPESIFLWDTLRWSTGFDFYRKPAIKNFGRFMAYFLPPGAPEGVFGDGAEVEMASSIARYAKGFAARAPSTLMTWYSKKLSGEDRSAVSMLDGPSSYNQPPDCQCTPPDSAYFPSVGWAAMHSSIADTSRLSVYFKSSSYGSFNHSHADQNSFVIHARGSVVGMDSGVYDYYGSPHWRDWYKQTRAHNAITYDGGIGQGLGTDGLGSKSLNGQIDKFTSTAAYDMVAGDATAAYQGNLSKAKRWVVLLRPNTVVVVDQLASATPRSWEWNYHTPTLPTELGGYFTNSNVKVATCTRVSSPAGLTYSMASGYTPAPQISGTVPSHYASRYAYSSPNVKGLFMSVISVDCVGAPPAVTWVGDNAEVQIGAKKVVFSGGVLSVQ